MGVGMNRHVSAAVVFEIRPAITVEIRAAHLQAAGRGFLIRACDHTAARGPGPSSGGSGATKSLRISGSPTVVVMSGRLVNFGSEGDRARRRPEAAGDARTGLLRDDIDATVFEGAPLVESELGSGLIIIRQGADLGGAGGGQVPLQL